MNGGLRPPTQQRERLLPSRSDHWRPGCRAATQGGAWDPMGGSTSLERMAVADGPLDTAPGITRGTRGAVGRTGARRYGVWKRR